MSMQTEPARIIGVVTAIVVAVIQTLVGQGVLSNDLGTSLVNIAGILLPILMAEVIRRFVSPASKSAGSSTSSGTTPPASTV